MWMVGRAQVTKGGYMPYTTKPSYFYEGFVVYGAGTRWKTRSVPYLLQARKLQIFVVGDFVRNNHSCVRAVLVLHT